MSKPNSHMQNVLDAHADLGPLPIESLTPEQARQIPLMDRAAVALYGQHFANRALAPMPPPVGRVENVLIPGPVTSLVSRIYTPAGKMPETGWPTVLYFHGGGFVLANLDTYDTSCRTLCIASDCVIVSVGYRLAPESPYPAAVQDALAAYQWLLSKPRDLNVDVKKIAVAGESAGGNLAAILPMIAREQGLPLPLHQVLIYPVTDMLNGPNSPSALANSAAKPLNKAMLTWFYHYYVPQDVSRSEAYLSPLLAPDLAGLPPATVILAEIDPLHSEGESYANRLAAAGVPVVVQTYAGVTHEFFGLSGLVNEAAEAVALAAKSLRSAFQMD